MFPGHVAAHVSSSEGDGQDDESVVAHYDLATAAPPMYLGFVAAFVSVMPTPNPAALLGARTAGISDIVHTWIGSTATAIIFSHALVVLLLASSAGIPTNDRTEAIRRASRALEFSTVRLGYCDGTGECGGGQGSD